MHPYLISHLAADRQAELTADAGRRRLGRPSGGVGRTAGPVSPARLIRPLRLALRRRTPAQV